jgi:GNAT superfamily N-acetyltransferase
MEATHLITQESSDLLDTYTRIPIRFQVRSMYEVLGDDPASAILTEKTIENPWIKDYDTIDEQGPLSWANRWNISNWGFLAAHVEGQKVGVCAIAFNTDGVNKLQGRDDIAFIWDIRVAPDFQGQGIGSQLFQAAAGWAKNKGCGQLHVETQNINVPACRFYQRQGCHLSSINRHAYDGFPDEIELIWSLDL